MDDGDRIQNPKGLKSAWQFLDFIASDDPCVFKFLGCGVQIVSGDFQIGDSCSSFNGTESTMLSKKP
jgi:hypothetical protein